MRRFLGILAALLLVATPALAGPMSLLGAGKASASAPASLDYRGASMYTFVTPTDTVDLPCKATTCNTNDVVIVETVVNGSGTGWVLNGSGTPTLAQLSCQQDGSSFTYCLFWGKLSASDASNGTMTSFNGVTAYVAMAVAYRGVNTVSQKQVAAAASTTALTLNSFSPTGGALGHVNMSINYAHGTGTITATNATWTSRLNLAPQGVAPFFDGTILDATNYTTGNIVNSTYPSGAIDGFIAELNP